MRARRLRKRYGRARYLGPSISWQGTDYIERRYHAVQPMLAYAALGRDTPSQRREAIEKGQALLSWLLSQKPAPTASARRFMSYKISDVRRLVEKAEANL